MLFCVFFAFEFFFHLINEKQQTRFNELFTVLLPIFEPLQVSSVCCNYWNFPTETFLFILFHLHTSSLWLFSFFLSLFSLSLSLRVVPINTPLHNCESSSYKKLFDMLTQEKAFETFPTKLLPLTLIPRRRPEK